MTVLALIGLIGILVYAVIKAMWIFCPHTLIRWADYFAIEIKEKKFNSLFEDEVKEKPIEVFRMEVKK